MGAPLHWASKTEIEQDMAMKPDTISLREVVIRKRYSKHDVDPERFRTLWALIWRIPWFETPEGRRFWGTLHNSVWKRFPKAKDVVLQNKPWR